MSDDTTGALGAGVLILLLLFYLGLIAFSVYVYVRIARKAGYSGWWAAMLFVPIANLVVMIMFAFVEWPIEREVKALRAGRTGGFGPAGYAAVGAAGYGQSQFGPSQFGQSQFGQISPASGQFGAPTTPQPGYGPEPLPSQPVFRRPDGPDASDAPTASERLEQERDDEPPSPYGAP